MKRGNVGRMQVTAGPGANELGPAAAAVALVAGHALTVLSLAMLKPSASSPAMPLKADMLDSLYGALVRDQRFVCVSWVGRGCTRIGWASGCWATRQR